VIVDTDMGADDVMALSYVAARPDVDLRAVTVAGTGLAHCRAGVRNARGILARLGRGDVPVACGRETPLSGSVGFPAAWRARADSGFGLELPSVVADEAVFGLAVDLLTRSIASAPSPVSIILLGPATNLAGVLAARPDLAGRIATLTAMGGALAVAGNVAGSGVADANTTAEWNVFADPTAWQAVLGAGLRVTVVPLDATAAVPLTHETYLAIGANRDGAAARLVFELLEGDPELAAPGQFLWDPLAAVAAFDPAVVTLRPATVRIDQMPGSELGRLVEDPAGARVTIATGADLARFRAGFISTLNGGRPVQAVPNVEVNLSLAFDGARCNGTLPVTMRRGFVGLTFENRAAAGAGGGLLALNDGVSADEIVATAARDPERLPTLGRIVLSVSAEPGRSSADVGVVTRAGTYLVGCVTYEPNLLLVPAGTLEVAE
jgi:pyrimidine-specific ribonucleoside hydrolase